METGLSSRPFGFPRAGQRLPVRQARIHYGGKGGGGASEHYWNPNKLTKRVQGLEYLQSICVRSNFGRYMQMTVDNWRGSALSADF